MEKSTNIRRLFDFPHYQLKKYDLKRSITSKKHGRWNSLSTKEYINQADSLSKGLLALGVSKNDKIALISSTNRTEWNICDIGILQTGAQSVPMYPTMSIQDYQYILNHSEAKYCFVSDEEILQKINGIKKETQLIGVYTFDKIESESHWTEILEKGLNEENNKELRARMEKINGDDMATLIYTSGTTGVPKGVMLSHKNIVSNVLSCAKRMPLDQGKDTALSFLPLCHIFERMIIYLYQYAGISIYYAESIESLIENLQEVKPNVMSAVPRLYEKIFDGIMAKGKELKGLKANFFLWAVDLASSYEPYNTHGWLYGLKLKLANKLVFSKWQKALGGKIKIMVSGAAALEPRLARIFTAAGLPIMEGYGQTETSPVVSVNDLRNKGLKLGTVGRIIDGVDILIAHDGEILVKGPNVMMGYFKDEDRTKEVISNGYFHTGDIGDIDQDGFLRITGRKKEIFKTSGGKYVSPVLIENRLKQSRFIEQAMVIGEGEKMVAAILQPNFDYLKKWATENKVVFDSKEELTENLRVIELIEKEVLNCNKNFGKWEQIKTFRLTDEIWSVTGGQLTPKLSMKRNVIRERYGHLYKEMYGINTIETVSG